MKATDFVKNNNLAHFLFYRKGFFYYSVLKLETTDYYLFPIPQDDLGDSTLNATERAMMLMRYINKAISENTMVLHRE